MEGSRSAVITERECGHLQSVPLYASYRPSPIGRGRVLRLCVLGELRCHSFLPMPHLNCIGGRHFSAVLVEVTGNVMTLHGASCLVRRDCVTSLFLGGGKN